MSINKKGNYKYNGLIPEFGGDIYRGQDMIRDHWFNQDRIGKVLKDLGETVPIIISGGIVTQGTGDTLNITPIIGYHKYQIEIPDSFVSVPPSKINADIEAIRVESTQQTNMAITSATLNGSAVNYIKIKYIETNGNTRQRSKKVGIYSYEVIPSFQIIVDTVVPTDYEICPYSFIGTAGGSFTFTEYGIKRRPSFSTDATFASNSDLKYPSEKAIQTKIDKNYSTLQNMIQSLKLGVNPYSCPVTTANYELLWLPYYNGYLLVGSQSDTPINLYFLSYKGDVTTISIPIWYNTSMQKYWQDPTNGDLYFLGHNTGITTNNPLLKLTNLFTTPVVTTIFADTITLNGFTPLEDGSGDFFVCTATTIKRVTRGGVQVGSTATIVDSLSYASSDKRNFCVGMWNGIKTYFCHNSNYIYYTQNNGISWTQITGISGTGGVNYNQINHIVLINNTLIVHKIENVNPNSTAFIYNSTDLINFTLVHSRTNTTTGTIRSLWNINDILIQEARGYATTTNSNIEISFDKGKSWILLRTLTLNTYAYCAIAIHSNKYGYKDEFSYGFRNYNTFEVNIFNQLPW